MPQDRKKFTSNGNKRFSARASAPTSAQVRRMVNKAVYKQSETKMCATTGTEETISSIASAKVFFAPVPRQGARTTERIGNKVKGVGLGSKLILHNNSTSEYCWVRCALLEVFDGQATGAEIQNDLFEGTADQTIGESGSVTEIIRKFDREYYKVHKDTIVGVGPKNTEDGIKFINYYHKLNGQEMRFNDSVALKPTGSSSFVWVVYGRETDGDESIGSIVECSYAFDYYYKE